MNRADRAKWKRAETIDDLAALVISWLNGDIEQTPSHTGGPETETIPLIPVLTRANRAGFLTEISQRADGDDEAWVAGFASDAALLGLLAATAGTPLIVAACRGTVHDCDRAGIWWYCPWKEVANFWAERCPHVKDELYACWYVTVRDPEPGRNNVLWPALEAFALASRVIS
ncbi:MAG TPA: hypothetical protein VGG54_23000 [Trebonia sp.]|jgi:hypothetical protein